MVDRDTVFMQRALRLARLGRGLVSPNPMVGAVVVKDDRIIGEGYHRYDRLRHAESYALEEAGEQSRGSTVYCTLEPCSHFGRTPPCIDALMNAEISRAVVAVIDPDPRVNGKGVRQLRERGVTVDVGLCGDAATTLNEIYFKYAVRQVPFLHLVVSGEVLNETGGSVGRHALSGDWLPSEAFLEAIVEYDAIVLRESGPWLPSIIARCVKRVRHRPLALIGSTDTLEATGCTANLDVVATSLRTSELLDINRIIDHLHGVQATSALVLGASPSESRMESHQADKLTVIEADEQSSHATTLERATVVRASGIAEITGYSEGPATD